MNFSANTRTTAVLDEGRRHHAAGELAAAETIYRRILEGDPNNATALHLLGLIAGQTGNWDAAIRLMERAVEAGPSQADVHCDLGNAWFTSGDYAQAEECYRAALDIDSGHVLAGLNLGTVLRDQGRHEEAVVHLVQLTDCRPNDPRVFNALGAALVHAGDGLAAMEYLGHAVDLAPENADIRNNLGLALHLEGQFDEAIAAYDHAISLDPQFVQARWNRVVTRMINGDWQGGLTDWAWRYRDPRIGVRNDLPQPIWDGRQLDSERILVSAEQGVGDQILFASLLPLLEARGGVPVIECDPRLVDLFTRSFAPLEVIAKGTPVDAVWRTSVIDLAQLLPATPAQYMPRGKYLKVDAERRANFRARLEMIGPGPYIGISWRSTSKLSGAAKTVPLEMWEPILYGRNATFVNLQYGGSADEAAAASKAFRSVIYTDPHLDRSEDMDGMAAMIDALDLVITVDNATAPLAGALEKPCWAMLRRVPMWHWGSEGPRSPLLYSPNLYRQSLGNRWRAVIAQITSDLDAWEAAKHSR